ncbi:hypothetical protein [uncultured Erythrobacter sp.]|uniref:hypothetical protein n=1 Tax=uncultured Erythrobacter sp. TaxID=263913 RepID=UPI002608E141|nr:hypothetical protein [uncultured Erythrobacter sp.]
MSGRFRIFPLALGALAMVAVAIPAHAQFRGLLRDVTRDAQSGAQAAEGCEKGSSGNTARGVIGGILGGAAGRTANRMGLGSFVPVAEFTNTISAEIACQLDEQEQKQAADATIAATTKVDEEGNQAPPEVGRSAEWTSGTRDGVSGTSTVTAREASSGGDDCITVTDVIIVEGEETRAEKRMCRLAGSPRYTIRA